MLINTSCSFSVRAYKQDYWCLQTAEAIWLYTLQYHIIIFDRFCWSLYFPPALATLHHSLPPVRKCSNVTDPYELPDFWIPHSPDQNIFHYKIWGSESTRKSTGCERFESASDWCMNSSVTERYWRWHWSVV